MGLSVSLLFSRDEPGSTSLCEPVLVESTVMDLDIIGDHFYTPIEFHLPYA
jgi:hypothetical protein